MEEGGPNLWNFLRRQGVGPKALPGDRLAWVGWRAGKPTLAALFNCFREGYVYGEPRSATVDSIIGFGAPTCEATPEVRKPVDGRIRRGSCVGNTADMEAAGNSLMRSLTGLRGTQSRGRSTALRLSQVKCGLRT